MPTDANRAALAFVRARAERAVADADALRARVAEAPLDAAAIGSAAADAIHHPERWPEWGTPLELRDHFKDLWVIVVERCTL